MPAPHVDQTIAAIAEPWFFASPALGRSYGNLLQNRFDARPDRQAIDDALALGGYLLHIESQRRKRLGLRAVLLANFLMKNYPVAEHAGLRRHYDSLSLDELKKEFVFLFPALTDNDNRATWHPAYFTDPVNLSDLKTQNDWRARVTPRYTFFVHTLMDVHSPVLIDPVSVLSRFSALSMSLVSNARPFSYAPQGVILRVPPNNILTTSASDQFTRTHAPSIHEMRARPEQYPGQPILADHIAELNMLAGGLRTPAEVLMRPPSGTFYNEVVVCGMAGVPLPHGVTGPLTLLGLFIATARDGSIGPFGNSSANERVAVLEGCSTRFGVPLSYLPRWL